MISNKLLLSALGCLALAGRADADAQTEAIAAEVVAYRFSESIPPADSAFWDVDFVYPFMGLHAAPVKVCAGSVVVTAGGCFDATMNAPGSAGPTTEDLMSDFGAAGPAFFEVDGIRVPTISYPANAAAASWEYVNSPSGESRAGCNDILYAGLLADLGYVRQSDDVCLVRTDGADLSDIPVGLHVLKIDADCGGRFQAETRFLVKDCKD